MVNLANGSFDISILIKIRVILVLDGQVAIVLDCSGFGWIISIGLRLVCFVVDLYNSLIFQIQATVNRKVLILFRFCHFIRKIRLVAV